MEIDKQQICYKRRRESFPGKKKVKFSEDGNNLTDKIEEWRVGGEYLGVEDN